MPHLGKTKSGYPLGHTSPTIIAQMLTFVEHHPVGLFLWCQAQALLSLRQPLIDDSSSHGSPFRNFRNNSVISNGEPLRNVTTQRSEERRVGKEGVSKFNSRWVSTH